MDYRYGSHTVFHIEYHFVWVTKYRYKVLVGEVAERVRELVRETCEAFELRIVQAERDKNKSTNPEKAVGAVKVEPAVTPASSKKSASDSKPKSTTPKPKSATDTVAVLLFLD
jgi:hypothetical protein